MNNVKMSKFTKISKWAEEMGYKVSETFGYGDNKAIRITINEEHHFKVETRESTIYQSIRGQKGDAGGLYLTHEFKPKDGTFIRPYGFRKSSQKEMIEEIENKIRKI